MIKANELRIGNLVINAKGENIIVDNITIGICFGLPKTYKPILLTEEILLKCGFKLDINKGYDYIDDYGEKQIIEDNPYWYINYNGKTRFCVFLKKNTCDVGFECFYLHTLQNVFKLRTGEELNVTL